LNASHGPPELPCALCLRIYLPGAATTGHELLTAQRLIVTTKLMDSAAAVNNKRKTIHGTKWSVLINVYKKKLQKKKN